MSVDGILAISNVASEFVESVDSILLLIHEIARWSVLDFIVSSV